MASPSQLRSCPTFAGTGHVSMASTLEGSTRQPLIPTKSPSVGISRTPNIHLLRLVKSPASLRA